MSLSLEFRKFDNENDSPLRQELFLDAFPETKGTSSASIEHYNWKFKRFPAEKSSYEYVAMVDNRMVGYYAAIPYPYKLRSKDYSIAMVCDVMTHSSQRGKGIFTKLGAYALSEMSKEGLDLALGYPIRKEVIPGHLKVGWKISGDLPLYLKVFKANSLLRNSYFKLITPVLNIFLSIFNSFCSSKDSLEYAVDSMDSKIFLNTSSSEFYLKKLSENSQSVLKKDAAFLGWRYGAPDTKYRTVMVKNRNDEIVASAFVRATVLKDIPTLAILDLQVVNYKREIISNLLNKLEQIAKSEELEMLSIMMTSVKNRELNLFRQGFIKSPFKFQLISRPLSEAGEGLRDIDASEFNPMWVDSDDL